MQKRKKAQKAATKKACTNSESLRYVRPSERAHGTPFPPITASPHPPNTHTHFIIQFWDSPSTTQAPLVVKNLPANARDASSIPGSGRSPGGGNGTPLQYSCLENPMDGGAWWATVCRIANSWTQLSTHTHTHTHTFYQMSLRPSKHKNLTFPKTQDVVVSPC